MSLIFLPAPCHPGPLSQHTSRTSSPSPRPYNDVLLTKEILTSVLYDLSTRLLQHFRQPVRIVVHGGAVMVLHPFLASRKSTRDVDYNLRSFKNEWAQRGIYNAGERLQACIKATAVAFNLGADWMNACADVALPMSRE